MSAREYLLVLRKRWLIVALVTVIGGVLAAATVFSATPIYRSTSSVYFSLPSSGTSGSDLFQGSDYTQSQMSSYAELATQPFVLDRVIADLALKTDAKQLADVVTAEATKDSAVLHVSASDPNPKVAAQIANSVSGNLAKAVKQLSPKSEAGRPTIDATLVAKARPSQDPISPRKKLDLAAGLLAGVFLGVVIALGREALDTRLRSAFDVEAMADFSVLGEIPKAKSKEAHSRVMLDDGQSVGAEAFRRVRTNLTFSSLQERPLAIVVSSAVTGEGKSSTALNLAVAMAETGQRVLLIDADLRRPSIANYIDVEGDVGLTNVLIGEVRLEEVVQTWGADTLDVVTSGTIPPNPSELLGSEAMQRLIADAKSRYDAVLLDCTPLLPVTDAAVLAHSASGVVLVTASGKTSRREFSEATAALEGVGGRVLGVVLNQVKGRKAGAYQERAHTSARESRKELAGGRRRMTEVGRTEPSSMTTGHDEVRDVALPSGTAAARHSEPAPARVSETTAR